MRIGGLASGMDTESIIKDMMKANRIPLDKITQKKQYLEWQLDDYRAVNRQLFNFSQNTFDNMILSTNFNQKTVTVSSPDDVAIKNISSSSEFSGTIEIHQLAKNATMQGTEIANAKGNSDSLTLSELGISTTRITINAIDKNGKMPTEAITLDFDSSKDTIKSVIERINKETGVNAFFDSYTGKIGITAKNSGDIQGGSEIVISGTLANDLGITGASNNGQNADFTFNGLRTQRSSNTFQINGFEVNLKQVTAGKVVTFNSSPDTDKIFDSIVKYVDDYNKMIEDLNKQIREPKYRSFQPLSAEQKKEMKEKEIELWEEKAKSGTLRNDSDISSMLTKIRTALSSAVGDMSLKDIGITTSNNYLDHGKLVINEDKLKEAITADPSKVHQLFAKEVVKDANGKVTDPGGLAQQLRTISNDTQKSISDRAGKTGAVNNTFTLGRTLDDMNKQIDRFEERLKMTENRLWKQFTAMENAIQRANAQSANMMNMFGGQ
ncbi:flagellar hook-associated protein 2 [Sporosarcina cyprini]|uniref:flagellar hook-associated protein 2 n=1 Tax=Sporosarcina cyprini TaxID=2910523 RepID=UPI001EE0BE69|nr:flagellar hook-associated protein 2 [Sporosarcina cyprini]MCG3089618.1 flagellar hook-associated protein 2 [Sporosarcina cyprini]